VAAAPEITAQVELLTAPATSEVDMAGFRLGAVAKAVITLIRTVNRIVLPLQD
jgi:hypothetical protein